MGPVTALVLSHCHGVDSHIQDTTVESFDQHFAVNSRASWLLIKEFGQRYRSDFGQGRIVALTSDLGITANVVNPGPINTGWMNQEQEEEFALRTPLSRPAHPDDCANLVRFLCSPAGGWVNGQLIHSDGGFQ